MNVPQNAEAYFDQTTVRFSRDSRDPITILANAGAAVAAARLERLMQQRDDSGAIGRNREFAKQALREDIGRLDARIRELTTARGMGGYQLSVDDALVQGVVRQRDELRAKLKRLDEHGRSTSAGRQTTGELYGRCELYVLGNRNLVPVNEPKPSLKKGETATDVIQRLRNQLTELESERESIRCAKLPSANAKEIARKQIDELAERGKPNVNPLLARGDGIEFPEAPRSAHVTAEGGGRGIAQWLEQPDSFAVLCWLQRDVMLAKLDQQIDEAADDKAALSDADRTKRIEELDADVLALERQECSMVWQSVESGAPIMLREGSDARAVLGLA